jgi:hypothetical protein
MASPRGCRFHPGPNGHQAIAELLIAPIRRAIREAAASVHMQVSSGPNEDKGQAPIATSLPSPMIPNYHEGPSSFCAILASGCCCRRCCRCFCRCCRCCRCCRWRRLPITWALAYALSRKTSKQLSKTTRDSSIDLSDLAAPTSDCRSLAGAGLSQASSRQQAAAPCHPHTKRQRKHPPFTLLPVCSLMFASLQLQGIGQSWR